MTPEEIATVVSTWQRTSGDRTLLVVALSDRLPGALSPRVDRARWIADAVAHLSTVLDRPGAFVGLATDLLTARIPVTLTDLAVDRDALMGALTDLQGPLSDHEQRAWSGAIGLFAEIVAAVCLDPFETGAVAVRTPTGAGLTSTSVASGVRPPARTSAPDTHHPGGT